MGRTTSGTVLQSFKQLAKRQGLATADESAIEAEELEKFRGSKFWIWDRDNHRQEYERTDGHCCFMHMLPSLPVKNGQEMPLFPWQREVFDALEHNEKNIAILKGRGVGGTQMLLLWAFYLSVRDDQMRNKIIVIWYRHP